MTRVADRERARLLRHEGKSYAEIKATLNIGKGTLSVWLRDMPLSATQIRNLRDLNPQRIEKFRETMRKKREIRFNTAYEKAKKDIAKLSQHELFLCGLYLYWGEGTKSAKGVVAVANTDPVVLRAFIQWLEMLGVTRAELKVKLHLYRDMNIAEETTYWAQILELKLSQFRKPYVKNSLLSDVTYKNGHGHGTCNVIFENVRMWEYITMALKRVRELHMRP